MSDDQIRRITTGGDFIQVNMDGQAEQIAAGKNIVQVQHRIDIPSMRESEIDQLLQTLQVLIRQIMASMPVEKQADALEKLRELEYEVGGREPNRAAIDNILDWFESYMRSVSIPANAASTDSILRESPELEKK